MNAAAACLNAVVAAAAAAACIVVAAAAACAVVAAVAACAVVAAAVKTASSAGTDMVVVLTDVSAARDDCTAAFELRLW